MSNAATTKQKVGIDLTEGNITKQLFRFALPLLLTNLLQQLYNAVDMAVIGHYVGSIGTVGVSSGGEIAALVTFLATSFGSAAQIYVAQLFGAKDHKSISETIETSLVFMTIMSLICMAVSILFCDVFLARLNTPREALEQARAYMIVVSLGLPFVFGYNAVCGILRGIGEARRPLMFVTVAAVSNLIMDILFVAIIPLEATGTAIATVTAQVASFVAAAIFLYKKKDHFNLDFSVKGMKIYRSHLKILVELGVPMTAQSALIHGTQLICASHVNSFGLVASATNSIGNKVQRLINVFTMSVRGGAGAMIGQNLGARKIERVKKIVHTTIFFSCIFSGIAALLAIFLPRQMFSLFTTDAAVVEFGVTYLRINLIVFALAPVQGSFGAVVTGSGHTKLSFITGVLDGVILRLGISFLFAYTLNMGVAGFFYGNALARLGPVIVNSTYYFSGKWKTRKLLVERAKE
ncbi:MAG: MATE family efflux transporter [Oscillospiraceae bacterium]|nr:MATE family efflux transporter [Oscillospiraceae bacterium]